MSLESLASSRDLVVVIRKGRILYTRLSKGFIQEVHTLPQDCGLFCEADGGRKPRTYDHRCVKQEEANESVELRFSRVDTNTKSSRLLGGNRREPELYGVKPR